MPLSRKALEKYGSEAFIETGFGDGDGVRVAHEVGFRLIYSIELDSGKMAKAEGLPFRVEMLYGDSGIMLKSLLRDKWGHRTTFWLDAHPCVNPMRIDQCPLLAEINAIRQCDMPVPFVMIDDMRVFSLPDKMLIEESLRLINGIRCVKYEDSPCGVNDIMIGTP